jgi:hypothetical protein
MGRKKKGKCRGEGRVNGFERRGEQRKFVTEVVAERRGSRMEGGKAKQRKEGNNNTCGVRHEQEQTT